MKRLLIASLYFVLMALGAMGAESLDLAGEWRLRLDPQDEGVRADWLAAPLAERDILPLTKE